MSNFPTILIDNGYSVELNGKPENYREVLDFIRQCAEDIGLDNVAEAIETAIEETAL